jgi:hypothetical protein
MLASMIALIVTLVGAAGFLIISLVHASAGYHFIFLAAAACVLIGPLIFLAYVVIGLCMEFASTSQRPVVKAVARRPPSDVAAASYGHASFDEGVPEGLRRERKGPLNRSSGRAPTNI